MVGVVIFEIPYSEGALGYLYSRFTVAYDG